MGTSTSRFLCVSDGGLPEFCSVKFGSMQGKDTGSGYLIPACVRLYIAPLFRASYLVKQAMVTSSLTFRSESKALNFLYSNAQAQECHEHRFEKTR